MDVLFIKFKQKITKEMLLAFLFSFFGGLIVHIYKFANYLPNHDSMYNFYNDQNVLGSGRWLLSIACSFSSYFDLPWVNGVLSLLFIALTTVIIVKLFEVQSTVLVFIISSLMVAFPSVTEILCFEFTADGFMISMLLSALAVYVFTNMIKAGKRLLPVVLSSVLICMSCGIYQAYLSFALVLFTCYIIWILLNAQYENKTYVKYLFLFAVSVVIALAAYYAIWKICMAAQGVSPNDYQGISKIGFPGIRELFGSVKSVAISFFTLLFEKNIFKHGITFYGLLNIVFLLFSAVILIVSVIKSKVFKSKFRFVLLAACVFFLPFAVCIWSFASTEVAYGFRMLHSVVLIYSFSAILCEKYIKNIFAVLFVILNAVMVFNLAVQANIAYYYLNFEYENTFNEASELKSALNEAKRKYGADRPVAIIGHREKDVALDYSTEAGNAYMYTIMIEKSMLLDNVHTQYYLKNVLYFDDEYVDSKAIAEIEKTEEYKKMIPFFKYGDIKMINDTIVVKLG